MKDKTHRFAIITSSWYPEIITSLTNGACKCLDEHRNSSTHKVITVPGCWEIPIIAQTLASQKIYDAIICLGVIIRGETLHFELIANEVHKALMNISLSHNIPITTGILATENREQAIARSDGAKGNKGAEATQAAIDIVAQIQQHSD